jgi:hypothetical protein
MGGSVGGASIRPIAIVPDPGALRTDDVSFRQALARRLAEAWRFAAHWLEQQSRSTIIPNDSFGPSRRSNPHPPARIAAPQLRRLRGQLARQYGRDHEVLAACDAPRFGSSVFVVDHRLAGRKFRSLASVGRHGRIYDQSSMDRSHPERLVFPYESFMAAGFALASSRASALLLGLGGGAMCRHLAARLPGCALTIVEIDPVIVGLTRRYFGVVQRVVVADAVRFMARNRERYDVVLVDLYDGRGCIAAVPEFWRNCMDSLAPGGCLAVNWADFALHPHLRRTADELALLGLAPVFLAPPTLADNLVQLMPTRPELAGADIRILAAEFFHEIGANGEMLNDCLVSREYPRRAAGGR